MKSVAETGAPKPITAQALDELLSLALAYRTGGQLRALVEFTRRFPDIAPFNAMLLHIQNPDIKFAARAAVWQRKYRRRLRPKARPYVILQTMGPVAFVFDLVDTEPIDPKNDLVPDLALGHFPTRGEPPPGALERLMGACLKVGIAIDLCNFEETHAGHVERLNKPERPTLTPFAQGLKDIAGDMFGAEETSVDFEITLNCNHTPAQQLGTLAHELAHIFCGHLGETEDGFWPDRRNTNLVTREFEAEAVAFFVTERMNLDIGSVQYLAGYVSEDDRLPAYSLDSVLKAVGKIEAMAGGTFKPPSKKRAKART